LLRFTGGGGGEGGGEGGGLATSWPPDPDPQTAEQSASVTGWQGATAAVGIGVISCSNSLH
jgi:hypothetical protein